MEENKAIKENENKDLVSPTSNYSNQTTQHNLISPPAKHKTILKKECQGNNKKIQYQNKKNVIINQKSNDIELQQMSSVSYNNSLERQSSSGKLPKVLALEQDIPENYRPDYLIGDKDDNSFQSSNTIEKGSMSDIANIDIQKEKQKIEQGIQKVQTELQMASLMNLAMEKVKDFDLEHLEEDTKILFKEMKMAITNQINFKKQQSIALLKSQYIFNEQFQDIKNDTIVALRKFGQKKFQKFKKSIDDNPVVKDKANKLRIVRLMTIILPMLFMLTDSFYVQYKEIQLREQLNEIIKQNGKTIWTTKFSDNLQRIDNYSLYLIISLIFFILYLNACGLCNRISVKSLEKAYLNNQKLQEQKNRKITPRGLWKKCNNLVNASIGLIIFATLFGFCGQWVSAMMWLQTDYRFEGNYAILTEKNNEKYQDFVKVCNFIIWLPVYIIPVLGLVFFMIGRFLYRVYYGDGSIEKEMEEREKKKQKKNQNKQNDEEQNNDINLDKKSKNQQFQQSKFSEYQQEIINQQFRNIQKKQSQIVDQQNSQNLEQNQ